MLALNKTELASYLASKAIQGAGGLKFDPGGALEEKKDNDGKIISTLWKGLTKGLTGFISGVISWIKGFSFQELVLNFIQGVRFALTFDFGQNDKSIDAQIKGIWEAWKLQTAGALGNAAGWFVCGGIANATVFAFNPVAGAAVLKDLGEEAFEEMMASLGAITRLTAQNTAKTQALTAFKSVRKWLKEPGNPIYPLLPESLKEAWKKDKPWTLGAAIQRKIISWAPPSWKELIEEFIEEFLDACQEALLVVASSLDRFVAERRQGILGGEVVLEVTPNREEPNQKYLLAGPQELIRSQLVESLTERRWLAGKDMGVMVDDLPREIILAASPFELYGWAIFEAEDGKSPGRRPRYQLPALKRSVLDDYEKIRIAFGGANGYLWGRWVATASNSTGHPLIVRGASAQEAEERLRALAELCDLKILTVNLTEEKKSDQRLITTGLQRDGKRVKPHSLVIINRKYFTVPPAGSAASKQGNWLEKKWSFDLRSPQKPSDWNTRLAEVLRGPAGAP